MHSPGVFRFTWLVRAYLWATELLYGPLAWAYDAVAWLVSFGYWSRWRLDALSYLQPGSVLEVGFGTGELLIALSERGYDLTGLELSPHMHRVTGRKLSKHAFNLKRVRGKTEAMPFPSGMFDNLLSTFPSKYILKQETLGEFKRVLDRQGRCVIVGLGVQFNSGVKRCLTNLWLGRAGDPLVEVFVKIAETAGFSTTIITHQSETYSLPVLYLERLDAK